MTYLQSGQATTSTDFRLRVRAAMFSLGQDVLNEDPATANHDQREALAKIALLGPERVLDQFVWLCATNAAIASSVQESNGEVTVGASDGDIGFVCASHWDTVADWVVTAPA